MFARRMIRDTARSIGFAPSDQARVSLATSALAHFLDLGGKHRGAISFHSHQSNGKPAHLQIVCTIDSEEYPTAIVAKDSLNPDVTSSPRMSPDSLNLPLEKVKGMVDDLHLETSSSENIKITLMQYIGSNA